VRNLLMMMIVLRFDVVPDPHLCMIGLLKDHGAINNF